MFYEGKVVWVTGASSGIGKALVSELAKRKAKIVLSARREEKLQEVAAQLNLTDYLILPLDLNDTANANSWSEQIISKFGKIDILINNGGVSQRGKAIDTSIDLDRKFMEVNFMSTVALTKSVLPNMLQNKSGNIVTISSILGNYGLALHSTYAASKHAVNGFYESLREELHQTGVNVNVISPGFINTEVSKNAITEDGSSFNEMSDAQAKGMPASTCAARILKAIEKNKRFKYVGGYEIFSVMVHHYFPRIFYWLMRKVSKEK